jgi:hypothetical protein
MRKNRSEHLDSARREDHVTVEFREAAVFVSEKLGLSCSGKNVG